MGVGGVGSDSTLTHTINLEHWEIGGYSGGRTTNGNCPGDDFCSIGGYHTYFVGSGGTSAAAANVAAIAGLIRAENPNLSNAQTRDRLRNTAHGVRFYRVADAEWAIENVASRSTSIDGPHVISTPGGYTWYAQVTGGLGSYTYFWEKREVTGGGWVNAGTGSQVGVQVDEGDPDFELRLTVTSHARRARKIEYVVMSWCDPEVDPECNA